MYQISRCGTVRHDALRRNSSRNKSNISAKRGCRSCISCVVATGKSAYVRRNPCGVFLDGNDIIFNDVGVSADHQDPAEWTDDERQTHMDAFISKIRETVKTCIAFSEVSVDLFEPVGITTVVV